MLRIDAHHHLWDPERADYPWMTAEFEVMRRTYTPSDLAPELDACGVTATIVVQSANDPADTAVLLEHAHATPWIAGVVAWAPLEDPEAAATTLDELSDDEYVRGIRHLAHNEPDPNWLIQRSVLTSLKLLGQHELVFEVPAVYPRHLQHIPGLATLLPDVRIVIDHLGKPPLHHVKAPFEHWAELLAACAARPNVFAKISGLGTSGDGRAVPPEDAAVAFERGLELFGPERLMFGSDWPVSTLSSNYQETFRNSATLIEQLSPSEQAMIFASTAIAVYRIPTGALATGAPTETQLA